MLFYNGAGLCEECQYLMRKWTDEIDPGTIPDRVLKSEWARRNSLKRRRFGAGTGRPKVMQRCSRCGAEMGSREFRAHRCAPNWKTRLVEGAFPDRQFDLEFWQEQGDEAIFRAAWEMVELAEEANHGRKPRLQRTVTHLE
jgi:hypothetical protein